MKITFINGNPLSSNPSFESRVNDLTGLLKLKGHTISYFELANNKIISCTGCWGCWVKTPGECLFDDDSRQIRKEIINSDWVIFASPIILGFTSAILKKMQDKLVPLVHPYIELVNDECHHEKRYENYPKMGLLYTKDQNTDKEDLVIIEEIYHRLALNFKTELRLFKSIEEPNDLLIHEIIYN